MINHQAVVDQIVQNLAFEVEAVPKNKTIQATSISGSMPLNVKIRVRKKEDHDVLSMTDKPSKGLQKIRLVSSDQTIMAFDVFMEAEFEKKTSRKLHKHIFDVLRPGICLGSIDDEDYPYMPSSSYSANITEPSVTTRPNGVLKQKFTLSKNIHQDYTVETRSKEPKWLFGKCKPGGCLDPPFSEDKYSYKPSTRSGHERIFVEPSVPKKEKLHDEDGESDIRSNGIHSKQYDEDMKSDIKSTGRHSSVFDGGLFKKRKKTNDKSTNTKSPDVKTDKTDSILSIYQVESTVNSLSTHSNSIITYPPKISSDLRISDDKTVRTRGTSEDKSRKSFNDHSEPYFIPPKGVNRIKEKDTFNQRDYPRHGSSDVLDLRNTRRESLKVPVLIPIPTPIPLVTNQRKPEATPRRDNIFETQVDNTNIMELKLTPDKELMDKINAKDTETPKRQLEIDPNTGDIDIDPVESLKKPSPVPFSIDSFEQQPDGFNIDNINSEIENKNLSDTKQQPNKAFDSKSTLKGTEQPEIFLGSEPSKIPIPIQNPVPLDFSKPDTGDTSLLKPDNNNIRTSYVKIAQSEQTFGIKETPHKTKEDQDIVSGGKSGGSGSNETTLQYSELSDKDTETIPKNYLDHKSDSFDQESDLTENEKLITKIQIMEGDPKSDSKGEEIENELVEPAKENDRKQKDDDNMELFDIVSDNYLEERTDGYKLLDADTDKIKPYSNEVQNEDFRRLSQIASPVLQKDGPVINNSKTSIRDDTKMDDKAHEHLYKVGHRSTDLSDKKDDIENMLRSGAKNETDNVSGNISPLYSNEENIAEFNKPQKVFEPINHDKVYSCNDGPRFLNSGISFITAPVIIAETKQTSQFGQLKQVYSEKNLLSDTRLNGRNVDHTIETFETQIASTFGNVVDDIVSPSIVSHELIGTKSVIYDLEDYPPSTSYVKNTETLASPEKHVVLHADTGSSEMILKSPRISSGSKESSDDSKKKLSNKNNMMSTSVLSPLPSTSTLKSALKKDSISVDLGFHSYLNDKNERILRTFDTATKPTRSPNDSVTIIKSQIKISSNEIIIPIDSDHDLSVQIKKSNANQRVSISESGFVNLLDNKGRIIKQRTAMQTSGGELKTSEPNGYDKIDESDIMDKDVIELYEQELVPLQLIIKNLRDEIDVLAAQQVTFRDKIFCPKKSKLPRLVHSNKKCFGCVRK